MIDKLEREVKKLYDQLDVADLKEIAYDRWPVPYRGDIYYVSGESHFAFLLGQWKALGYVLKLIERVRWEEKDNKVGGGK